jgi:hypothetical protein
LFPTETCAEKKKTPRVDVGMLKQFHNNKKNKNKNKQNKQLPRIYAQFITHS